MDCWHCELYRRLGTETNCIEGDNCSLFYSVARYGAHSVHTGRDDHASSYSFTLNARAMRAGMPALHSANIVVLSLGAVGNGVEEKRQRCNALAAILRAEAEHDDVTFATFHFNDGGF